MRPVTLITGASAGIGAALAHEFRARTATSWCLIARRGAAAGASSLMRSRRKATSGRWCCRSISLRPMRSAASPPHLRRSMLEPRDVVNNAGFGLVGAAAKLDRAEQLAMIDLNVRALTDLSLAFVETLQRHRGGILNVASVAGFLPGPGMAVYYASKAYVLSFSEALHRELKPRGVRVTVLCPGPVPTEFQARAGVRNERYPPLVTQTAEQVAQAGYRGLMAGRRLVVPGIGNKLVTFLLRLTPRGLAAAGVEAQQRLRQ